MTVTEWSITRVSFAVRLIDDFTTQPSLIGSTEVFITGTGEIATSKPTDYHLFTNLTATNVTVRIENKHYAPKEVAVNIPALEARNPVTVQTLKPSVLYPFPPGSTLVRGIVVDAAQRPIQGAHVSVTGAALANDSGEDGRFVLYWRPLDEDDISVVNHRRLVKVGNSTTIDLSVSHPSFQTTNVTIGIVVEAELKLLSTPIVMNP